MGRGKKLEGRWMKKEKGGRKREEGSGKWTHTNTRSPRLEMADSDAAADSQRGNAIK